MKLIYAITILLATSVTFAHADEGDDDDDGPVAADVLLERDYPASANIGAVHLLVHQAGHLAGQPYVVELSERCPVAGSTATAERVVDTTSACDVALNTLAFDPVRSEVSLVIRGADEGGQCSAKPKRVIFALSSGCGED